MISFNVVQNDESFNFERYISTKIRGWSVDKLSSGEYKTLDEVNSACKVAIAHIGYQDHVIAR